MCIALRIQEDNKTKIITFRQKMPLLPYLTNTRTLACMQWGRSPYEQGNLPIGGWAREDCVLDGKWDAWFPKKILIPVVSFCLLDFIGRSHWFDVCRGEFLQAIVAQQDHEQRLYLSIELTQRFDNLFWHWPLIIRKPKIQL